MLMSQCLMKETTTIMKTFQISLDDDLHRRAKTVAYQTGSTLADLVRRAIEEQVVHLEEITAVQLPARGVQ